VRLNELSPAPGSTKDRKRLGRGKGSGDGKTSGRGHKGAGARSGSTAHSTYEGGQMPLQRRLPRLKGMARGRHTVARPTVYAAINVGQLENVSGDTIGFDELRAAGLVGKKEGLLVKILGDGEISRAVTVKAHAFSKTAKEKIEAAGGSTEILER
jgi:large subunit ribosomal protein L15